MAEIRKRIVFHGRVQGVGFRYTAKYLAQSLELTREALINKLLVGLNQGRFIDIQWMDTEEIPLEEEREFTVKY